MNIYIIAIGNYFLFYQFIFLKEKRFLLYEQKKIFINLGIFMNDYDEYYLESINI